MKLSSIASSKRSVAALIVVFLMTSVYWYITWNYSEPVGRPDQSSILESPNIDGRSPDGNEIRTSAGDTKEEHDDANNLRDSDAAMDNAIVDSIEPEIDPELAKWADNFYRAPNASVKADRYRFVSIDWNKFYSQLHLSPAYLAASSGRTPPPVYEDSPATFNFAIFDDQHVRLLVKRVQFFGDEGSRRIVLDGDVVGADAGEFRLATTEGMDNLSGQIDTADFLIRVDTRKGANATSLALFDRKKIESARVPID